MVRRVYIVLLFAFVPVIALAQVQKEVEVTKAYAPSVEQAQKMAIVPNMVDTVKMEPEIDYRIESRSYQTSLMLENFKPATISYWDYQRRYPLYVKAGVGVPLASEVDAYVSTVNKDRGYAMAYINHWGDYRNRRTLDDMKTTRKTTELSNRVGGRAGFFLGKKTLEVDLYADQQVRHRYPVIGDMIRFGELQGKLRLGDDFVDLSRWNFNVELGGGMFFHRNRALVANDEEFKQSNVDAKFELAKRLGKHLFRLNMRYSGAYGAKALSGYDNHLIFGGLRYGVSGKKLDFALGVDYYYNKIIGRKQEKQGLIPYVRLSWKNSKESFVPYAELGATNIDNPLQSSSLAKLMYENPYFVPSAINVPLFTQLPYRLSGGVKVGIDGTIAKGVFSYTVSLELRDYDQISWIDQGGYYQIEYTTTVSPSHMGDTDIERYEYVVYADRRAVRLNGGFKLRPLHWLELEADLSLRVKQRETDGYMPELKPKFTSGVDLRYTGRKITASVGFDYRSKHPWLQEMRDVDSGQRYTALVYTGGEFELGAEVEWQVSDRWGVYIEGRNLTGCCLHEWLHYYTSSPQALVGVKMNF
ncbi:MAG: hypothetical protein J6B41_06865 [Alistipes sp.]|nr:hypothetical protein [Alistipes sp.]